MDIAYQMFYTLVSLSGINSLSIIMAGVTLSEPVRAPSDQTGWRGLIQNGKIFAITAFASLGGVLYGYNQGVFSQVQVMAEFDHRFNDVVSLRALSMNLYHNADATPSSQTRQRKAC